MKKYLPLLLLICLFGNKRVEAQFSRYIVKLKDKGSNPFTLANPLQYLSQQAVDRRTKYNIAIDSTDLPITPRYLDSIRLAGNVTILNVSKWLNQVAISTTDAAALAKINSFSFVLSAGPIAAREGVHPVSVNKQMDVSFTNSIFSPPTEHSFTNSVGFYDYGKSNGQVKISKGDFLHNLGFRGQGMQITLLDAGFYHYLSLPTFDSVRANNQILGTWDFVANEVSVDEDYVHGMQCLSAIGANIPGTFVGTAPKASFYLYRTEDVASEYPIEEQNWVAGIEKADSLGVPVSSTSLGYQAFDNPAFNHTYADMDGNTTISARGADFAAKKGMLLVIAAGNTGTDPSFNKIITPADADSVLSIGAVDTLGNVASFSAYGPSSDGQVKPSVAAVGFNAYVANPYTGLPIPGNGTSFACPNMAGLATCLWQAFPEVNNMSVIDAIEKSASKATSPDTRIGYGIPDMKKAFVLLIKKLYTQSATINKCNAALAFSIKTGKDMTVELQRKLASDSAYGTINTFSSNNAFAINNFTYTDDLSLKDFGVVHYRLKMNIATDTTFFIDSTSVNYTESCLPPANKITIGPNPVVNNLKISIERTVAAKIGIAIFDAAGRKVYQKQFQQNAGIQVETVPMQGMSKGVYFVTIFIDGKKTLTNQIIK